MPPPEVIIIPIMFVIPSAVIVVRMWFKHTERMAGLSQPSVASPEIEARLERVEQAIEAIAVEMERVGEGQRFLTRILSEKSQLADGSAQRGRVITPH